jgi:hypothetical protein
MNEIKIADIKIEECASYEEIAKQQQAFFKAHYPSVLADFKKTHKQFVLDICKDPSVPAEHKSLAENAVMNYFLYFCFGCANMLDNDSNFQSKFESINNKLVNEIEEMANEEVKDRSGEEPKTT